MPIKITSDLKEIFDSVNEVLSDACQLASKQRNPGTQFVLMTDASFRCAGYALMIEDKPDQKIQSKRKTYARKFSPLRNSKCSYTQKKFWLTTWYFSSLHTFSGSNKANNCPHRQQMRYTFFPNDGFSASTLECM